MSTNTVMITNTLNMAVPVAGALPDYTAISGDMVKVGYITGRLETDRHATTGFADVKLPRPVEIVDIRVTANAVAGNISIGDQLYMAAAAPWIVSNDPSPFLWGIAYEALAVAGGLDTPGVINVIMGQL